MREAAFLAPFLFPSHPSLRLLKLPLRSRIDDSLRLHRCASSMWTRRRRAGAALLLVLAAPCCGLSDASHRRLLDSRIDNFDGGSHGWRILPSLPTPSVDDSARLVLSVSADDSPAYFLAPNDLVSQVKQSAALRPVPDVSVRVSLEVPASCWSGGWRCTFRFAVVGAECSLHRVFSPPAPSAPSVQGPTTTQIAANLTWFRHAPVDAKEWAHCSEILKPDGYGSLFPVCLYSCSVHSADRSTRYQDLR